MEYRRGSRSVDQRLSLRLRTVLAALWPCETVRSLDLAGRWLIGTGQTSTVRPPRRALSVTRRLELKGIAFRLAFFPC